MAMAFWPLRLPRRPARAEPAAARGRVQRRDHGARARVPHAVARRADRLRLRRGRRARARARPAAARVADDHGRRRRGDRRAGGCSSPTTSSSPRATDSATRDRLRDARARAADASRRSPSRSCWRCSTAALRVSRAAQRAAGRVAGRRAAGLTVGAIAGGLVVVGDPVQLVARQGERVQAARHRRARARRGSARPRASATTSGASRCNEFRPAPLTGVGEGSYPQRYYVERTTDRNLSTPHSLPIAVLAETGLVGLLLLLAMPVAAVVRGRARLARAAARRAPRRRPRCWRPRRSCSARRRSTGCGRSPRMAGLGLLCLALGVAIVTAPETAPAPASARLPLRIVGIAVPLSRRCWSRAIYLSDLDVRLARADRDEHAAAAARRPPAPRERLNPLALPPRYLQAGALESLGRRGAARRELLRGARPRAEELRDDGADRRPRDPRRPSRAAPAPGTGARCAQPDRRRAAPARRAAGLSARALPDALLPARGGRPADAHRRARRAGCASAATR